MGKIWNWFIWNKTKTFFFLSIDVDDIDYTCNVPVCPYPCTCFNGVVDCKDKDLIEIPRNVPDTTIEL